MSALLIAGHGTRTDAGVAEFHWLVARVARQLAANANANGTERHEQVDVAGGFIELAPPPLADSVAALVARGHRHLVVVPLVLVAAGHAKGDMPAAMAREQRRHPGLTYSYGRPLGPHPILQSLLAERIDAALAGAPRDGTAIVLVGRGSTDPDGNAEVAKVARLLWEGRGFSMAEPAFVSLAWPGVPAALERARLLGATRIVVAPYFLFPGVLPQRIARQSQHFAAVNPELDVRVADVLGDSADLAGLVLERYREAITGDIRMNCDTCMYRTALPGFTERVGAPQRPHDHPDDPAHQHHHDHVHQH